MTHRITVVLEYPSTEAVPPIGFLTKGKDLGDGEVCAVQFSDALRELEVLEEHATKEVRRLAWEAAESYGQQVRDGEKHG